MGVAIHNLSLLARTRELATLEERDSVAREMHDRLAQSLACRSFQAAVAEEAVRVGRVKDVAESLREIKSMASAADRPETRRGDLSPAPCSTRNSGEGLLTTLQAFAGDCARRYGLHVRVEPSEGWHGHSLSSDTETQLLLAVQAAASTPAATPRPGR